MKQLSLFFTFIFLFIGQLDAQPGGRIVLGTVYNPFHSEYDTDAEFFRQVDHDFKLIKESNFTHVLLFPMSQWDPETQKLKWTRTDYMVKKLEELDLKLVPLMLKEEQDSHYFPIWKFRQIKGIWDEYSSKSGNPNTRENVDFADPRIYPLVDNYFKKVVERYGDSPALSFYNIWNEPHYQSKADHVVEKFKTWLKDKYGSLDKLRKVWGEEYTSWDEVTPFLNDNWDSSMPQIDWTMFQGDLNGMLLDKLIATLRKYDKTTPVNANPVSTPIANFSDYGFYNQDNWPLAEHGSFHGISYYPDIWERSHDLNDYPYWLHNLTFNTVRSAASASDKHYILSELYTNSRNGLVLNGYLNKTDVRLLGWTALANEAKGMIYWKWRPFYRGRQSLGRGLTHIDGTLASRGEAAKEIGSVLNKYGDKLFKARLRKPKAAIILDMVGLQKTLKQSSEGRTRNMMFESNAGVFKALYEKNISVDLLRADRGLDQQKLNSYEIIYLPFQVVMRQELADILKVYVKQGGWLVADARTATLDELDFAYRTSPGAGLVELFGASRPDWKGDDAWFKVDMQNGQADFEGKYFRDKLDLTGDAEVLGSFDDNGHPAVIKNSYGEGYAILSAVPLGASFYSRPQSRVDDLITGWAEEAGVVPDANFTSDDGQFINVKVHDGDGYQVVYLINDGLKAVSGRMELSSRIKAAKITDILHYKRIDFAQADHNITTSKMRIGARDAAVLLIE